MVERTRYRLDAAGLGVTEIQLMGIALGLHADRRLDDIGDRRARHPPLDPIKGHLFCRYVPYLLIVRDQVFLSDTLAKNVVDPFFEISRLRVIIFQIVVETFETICRG